MPASHASAAGAAPIELVVSRLIDAPRALVFKAWTQQEHAARWWGPRGFTVESCRLDATQGGTYRVAMRSPDGTVRTKRGCIRRLSRRNAWYSPMPGKMPTAQRATPCTSRSPSKRAASRRC